MNIRFLKTAIWLAQNRSFRLTAEQLNITQAAISSRIATLEQDIGVRLFDRQGRDVTVTPEGEEFIQSARAIVEMYDELSNRFRAKGDDPGGLVRMGVVSSMAHTLLPEITRTLREEYKSISFEITTDTSPRLFDSLVANKLDVCLTTAPTDDIPLDNLEVVPLVALGIYWVVSPGLLKESSEVYAPSDLAHFPLITYTSNALNAARIKQYLGADYGTHNAVHVSNSLATTVNMAIAGIGTAAVPPVMIQRELREGLLHVLNVNPPFPPTSYAAIFPSIGTSRIVPHMVAVAQAAAQRFCAQYSPALASFISPDGKR